jgi:Kef-type K+ transport system membrane component KefB
MIDQTFIRSLGLMIVFAAVFALAARRARMPTIAAYLLAGLVLGPGTGLVKISHSLEIISEMGIALLLFLVGLELSFEKFKDVGKVAIPAGLAQVIATTLGGLAVCHLLGFGWREALFLAAAMTFSSTVVVVKLLDEKKELYSLHGRLAVGIFLVQDIVVILALTLLAGSGHEGEAAGGAAWRMIKALAGMGVLVLGVVVASSRWLAGVFRWAAGSPETMFIWSLAWCFGLVAAAHALGLSPEIGAFLAGLGLAQLPHNLDLRRRVHPLMNFFVAVFFVSLGVKMDLGSALSQWGVVLLLSVFVLAGKLLLVGVILRVLGQSRRTAFLAGVTVAQVSEFSFILVAQAEGVGLVGPTVLPVVTLVGLVTITVSSCLILNADALHDRLRARGWLGRRRTAGTEDAPIAVTPLRDHVIIVGMNTLGRDLVRRLCAAGENVLAIDTDVRKLEGLPCAVLIGNIEAASVLEEAELAHAKLAVSTLHIEETNDLLAFHCKRLGVPCAVHVVDLSVVDNLLEMDATYLMIPKVDGVKLQNRLLKEMGYFQR